MTVHLLAGILWRRLQTLRLSVLFERRVDLSVVAVYLLVELTLTLPELHLPVLLIR